MNQYLWLGIAAFALYMFFNSKLPAGAVLSPAEVRTQLESAKDTQLIDVRTPAEFAQGKLAGAKNIPLSDLGARLGELATDKPVIVYCRSGHRSTQALKLLLKSGFPQAKHMDGGINLWQGAGLPVSK